MANCKYCNAGPFNWHHLPEGWRLFDPQTGELHTCLNRSIILARQRSYIPPWMQREPKPLPPSRQQLLSKRKQFEEEQEDPSFKLTTLAIALIEARKKRQPTREDAIAFYELEVFQLNKRGPEFQFDSLD